MDLDLRIKKGDIIYHQYLAVPLEVISTNICETKVKNCITNQELMISNEYIITKGNRDPDMREKLLDFIFNEESIKQKIKKEDEN